MRIAEEIDDSAPVTYGELRAAVAAEREACAKVAEEYEGKLSSWEDTYICDKIAEEIRARKD
jgi:hypothetical protein